MDILQSSLIDYDLLAARIHIHYPASGGLQGDRARVRIVRTIYRRARANEALASR